MPDEGGKKEWIMTQQELYQLMRLGHRTLERAGHQYDVALHNGASFDEAWARHEEVAGDIRQKVREACNAHPELFPIPAP
jgi:hypothetical protein